MASDLSKVLGVFVKTLIQGNDFTVAGVETARQSACSSFVIHEHKPPPVMTEDSTFVQTTLKEAIEKYKQPVHIPYFTNEYGNMESTIIKGLVFAEKDGQITAVGIQDGPNIAPLGINQLRCCYANGYRFDKSNTIGSAQTMTGPLAK